MRFWPRHVRSRLTLWYVVVLGGVLVLYAGGALLFLLLSLREELDRNLVEDVETVEGLLANEPGGFVSFRTMHPEENDSSLQRFVEVWSPTGSLLYRSPLLQGQALGRPPKPDADTGEPQPFSQRLANGLRVRTASSTYHIEDRPIVLRVAHSEEGLWRGLCGFFWGLPFSFSGGVVLAGGGGVALGRKGPPPAHHKKHPPRTP